jgi:steroid delta-isomerase-like uncharacterized protein
VSRDAGHTEAEGHSPSGEEGDPTMPLFAIAIPIVPGQRQRFDRFIAELQGPRAGEFAQSRKNLGVHERTFLQQTPESNLVIVTLEGDDPVAAFAAFGSAQDEFTDWFVQEVKAIHGVDLRNPPDMKLPTKIADSGSIEERNRAVVQKFIDEALNRHDWDATAAVFAENYVNYGFMPDDPPMSREEVRPLVEMLFSGFPDLQIEVDEMVADGDTVITRYTARGTHQGEFNGIPATGRTIAVPGMSYYRLKDGKIVEDRPGINILALLTQLGVAPVPTPAG